MPRMCAIVLFLALATIAAVSAQAARLGYSRAYCLNETLPAAEAISACTAVLQKIKNNAAVFLRRGAAFGELGAFDYAIGDFSRAISLAPDHALALRLRGLAYEMRGRAQESLADYRRLQGLGQSDPELEAAIQRLVAQRVAAARTASALPVLIEAKVAAAAPSNVPPPDASASGVAGSWAALSVAGLICAGAALALWRLQRRNAQMA